MQVAMQIVIDFANRAEERNLSSQGTRNKASIVKKNFINLFQPGSKYARVRERKKERKKEKKEKEGKKCQKTFIYPQELLLCAGN